MGGSRPSAKGRPNYVMVVWGRTPQRGPEQSFWSGVRGKKSPWSWWHFLISETNFLTKLSYKFGKFRLHGVRRGVYASIGGGAQSHFSHTFLTLLQIQVLNKNLTNNPGEDMNQDVVTFKSSRCRHFKNCIRRKCESSSIQTSAKLRWGVETRPPGSNFDER